MPEQTELFFAPPAQTLEGVPEEPTLRPTERAAKDENIDRLPSWAQELLEQSGVTDAVQQKAVFSNASGTSPSARQISWTAPAMSNPLQNRSISGPADLSYKEQRESEETPYQPRISDAELQRTADKVYRMIEERLRRELRRSGR